MCLSGEGGNLRIMKLCKFYAQKRHSCDGHLIHSSGFSEHAHNCNLERLWVKNSIVG